MGEVRDFTWLKHQIYDVDLYIYQESISRFADLVATKVNCHAEDPKSFINFPDYYDFFVYSCDTFDRYYEDFCRSVDEAFEGYQEGKKNPDLQKSLSHPKEERSGQGKEVSMLNYLYGQKDLLKRNFYQWVDESLPPDFDFEQMRKVMPDLAERQYSQKSGYCSLIYALVCLFPDLIEEFEKFILSTGGPLDLELAKGEVKSLSQFYNGILNAIVEDATDFLAGTKTGDPGEAFKNIFEEVTSRFFDDKINELTKTV